MNLLWQWLLAYWLGATSQVGQDSLAISCQSCHQSEYETWKRSRHGVAFTNGLFRGEYDAHRRAWCASCHAPSVENPFDVSSDDLVARDGVSCVACHLDSKGEFVSSRKAENSPHATVVRNDFRSEETCERCHQFNFPVMGKHGMPVGFLALPMQDTVAQFGASQFAAKGLSCISCHMESPDNHLFPGSHTPSFLRSALSLRLCKEKEGQLRIVVANTGAAHSVPTGGVNRHMVLRTWLSSTPESLQEIFIGRKFHIDQETQQKTLTLDTSIAAGETRTFHIKTESLGADSSEAINTELRYIYPLEEFAPLPPNARRAQTIFRERFKTSKLANCGLLSQHKR